MLTAYAACDECHTWGDIKVLRVAGSSHGVASASVGASSFPRRATRMGARRPAPGCERGPTRRTRDAIASLDRPALYCDRMAGKGGVAERTRANYGRHSTRGRTVPRAVPVMVRSDRVPVRYGFHSERGRDEDRSVTDRGPFRRLCAAVRARFRVRSCVRTRMIGRVHVRFREREGSNREPSGSGGRPGSMIPAPVRAHLHGLGPIAITEVGVSAIARPATTSTPWKHWRSRGF